ncbi:MAG: TcpQ domain-containing protein, partial [Cognaticolwellia sp.]
GAIIIALAVALFINRELLFSLGQDDTDNTVASTEDLHQQQAKANEEKQEDRAKALDNKNNKQSVVRPSKSKNAAAEGLSRFYANVHGEMDEDGVKIRNNIVYLPEPKGDLEKILEARRLITRPLRQNWTGKTDNHPFRQGETLFQKLSEYAKANGLEIIWWLNRDFLVKDAFRINKNIISTSYQIGNAIEGHFENGLSVYFCYQQRTIVLIDNTPSYLVNECLLLPKSKN